MGNCLKTEVSDDESLLGESDQETNGEVQRNRERSSGQSGQSGRRRDRRRRTRVRGYMAPNVLSIPDPTHYFNLGTKYTVFILLTHPSTDFIYLSGFKQTLKPWSEILIKSYHMIHILSFIDHVRYWLSLAWPYLAETRIYNIPPTVNRNLNSKISGKAMKMIMIRPYLEPSWEGAVELWKSLHE